MLPRYIPKVLDEHQVAEARTLLERAEYEDGRVTGAKFDKQVKNNQQVRAMPEQNGALVDLVEGALLDCEGFTGAVYPRKLHLIFNRYDEGMYFGPHNDAAIVGVGMASAVRTDASFTLFLSDIDSYEGGELVVRVGKGHTKVKLGAGDAVVYDASTVHEVRPVKRGIRLAAIGWVQSFVPNPLHREILAEFRQTWLAMMRDAPDSPHLGQLGNVYNRIMRLWCEN